MTELRIERIGPVMAGATAGTSLLQAAIDTPEAHRYADAIGVESDLSMAIDALTALATNIAAGNEGTPETQALWVSALVNYGRVFGGGVRGGYRVSVSGIRAMAPGAAEFHQWLLDMRNKHVAHSVNPFEQTAVGVILAPAQTGARTILGVGQLIARYIGPQREEDVTQAARFVSQVRELVRSDLPAIEAAVLASAEAIPIDELYARPPMELVAPGPEVAGQSRPSRRRSSTARD